MNLPSNNFEEDISPEVSNNNKKEIKSANIIGNDNENSRSTNIYKQRLIIPN